jgi:hypothetical protein
VNSVTVTASFAFKLNVNLWSSFVLYYKVDNEVVKKTFSKHSESSETPRGRCVKKKKKEMRGSLNNPNHFLRLNCVRRWGGLFWESQVGCGERHNPFFYLSAFFSRHTNRQSGPISRSRPVARSRHSFDLFFFFYKTRRVVKSCLRNGSHLSPLTFFISFATTTTTTTLMYSSTLPKTPAVFFFLLLSGQLQSRNDDDL